MISATYIFDGEIGVNRVGQNGPDRIGEKPLFLESLEDYSVIPIGYNCYGMNQAAGSPRTRESSSNPNSPKNTVHNGRFFDDARSNPKGVLGNK